MPSSSLGWEGCAAEAARVGSDVAALASDVIIDDVSAVAMLTSVVGEREDVIVVDETAGLRVDALGAKGGGAASTACIKPSLASTRWSLDVIVIGN